MSQNTSFYGREQELADLWELWELATKKDNNGNYVGSPQMKIILGETGLGKSRLVQAFYEQLSSHPEWDPKDHNYWPDFFNDRDNQLHVNPISKNLNADHNPQGAPKFLWFGSRWQSEEERNKEERICVIPHLREILDVHVKIAVRNSPIWLKMRRVSGKVVKSYDISDAADFGEIIANFGDIISETIPFANLVKKSYETGKKELNSQASVGRQQEKVHQEAADMLLEEMHYVFGGFGSGGLKLPSVLWLDDAQWIDGISQQFVHQLWEVAKLKKWPLLILITHWEREWNILKEEQNQRDRSLLTFGEHATVLTPAESGHLRQYLDEKLPGLKADQRNLLIEKSDGNFLTLVENVGYLLNKSRSFHNRDSNSYLTEAAVKNITKWESKRDKRIEERFDALEEELQELLGWSSEAGEQFLEELLAEMINSEHAGFSGINIEGLNICQNPYAILGRLNTHMYNFRDRAYYRQARKYLDDWLKPEMTAEQQKIIDNCWVKVLVEWINNSFDGQGNLIENGHQNSTADERRITTLEVLEQQKLLETCLPKLPIPLSPDWNNPYDVASFRMRYLLITTYDENGLYTRISGCTNNFDKIEWENLTDRVVSVSCLNDLVDALILAGHFDNGIRIAKRCVDISEQTHGPGHPQTARSLDNLAGSLQETGNYEEAEPLYRRSLSICEETLGPRHPYTASSLNNLASLLKKKGNFKEAETLHRRSLSICEETLGLKHHQTAISLDNLAGLLQEMGNYEEAEALYRRSLNIKQESLGEEHLSTAISLNNLAGLLQETGNYEEAEPLYKRSLSICEETLGLRHSHTASSLNNLALLFMNKGNYEEAEPLQRRSLDIYEETLGSWHPLVATSLDSLAGLLQETGNYEEAEPLQRRSLDIYEETLGPRHPKTAVSLNNMARLHHDMWDYEEAESMYRRSLDIYEETLSPWHPLVATSLDNLARLLQETGNQEEAESLQRRSLNIYEKTFGPSHHSTATSLNNMARLLQGIGNYDEAEQMYRRSLDTYKKALGPKHPLVATSLNNLASLLQEKGNFEEAETLHRRSLSICEETLGLKHHQTATSLSYLAELLQEKGNYEEAEPLYRRSLSIVEELFSSEHPLLVSSLIYLAIFLQDRENYEEAELLYRRSLSICEKTLGPRHPHTASTLNYLAGLLRAREDYKEAESLYRRSLDIREDVFGPSHPKTVDSLNSLADLLKDKGDYEEAESILRQVQDIEDNLSED